MCDKRMSNNERVNEHTIWHMLVYNIIYIFIHIEYIQSFDQPWSVKCIRKRICRYISIFSCVLPKYNNGKYLYLRVVVVSIARTQWPQPLQVPLALPCIALANFELNRLMVVLAVFWLNHIHIIPIIRHTRQIRVEILADRSKSKRHSNLTQEPQVSPADCVCSSSSICYISFWFIARLLLPYNLRNIW